MSATALLLLLSLQIPPTAECDLSVDTDGDRLPDCIELFLSTDPDSEDTDADGIPDFQEVRAGANRASDPDTDGDGLCDGDVDVEGVCVAGEDLNLNGRQDPGETSALCRTPAPLEEPEDRVRVRGTNLAGCGASGDPALLGLLGLWALMGARRRRRPV